jgi:RNA polymerase sigma factor (sigma-70 family)
LDRPSGLCQQGRHRPLEPNTPVPDTAAVAGVKVTAVAAAETTHLFQRMRDGSGDAEAAFYDRCARKLLALIRLRMGPALRAGLESRDILQAVLLKTHQRIDQVQDPAAVMGWMVRIAENEIRDQVDYQHRQRRDAALQAPIEAANAVPAPVRQALSQAILNEEASRVEHALESLPDDQRTLIVMRKLEERSFAEIGEALGKSPDACRMAFSRAMAALTLALAGTPGTS